LISTAGKIYLFLIGVRCCSVVLLLETAEHEELKQLLVIVLVIVSPADTDEVVA